MHTANSKGAKTPLCLTPFLTVNNSKNECPHITREALLVYINNTSLKINNEMRRFINHYTA